MASIFKKFLRGLTTIDKKVPFARFTYESERLNFIDSVLNKQLNKLESLSKSALLIDIGSLFLKEYAQTIINFNNLIRSELALVGSNGLFDEKTYSRDLINTEKMYLESLDNLILTKDNFKLNLDKILDSKKVLNSVRNRLFVYLSKVD